jgi:hypothetical protein
LGEVDAGGEDWTWYAVGVMMGVVMVGLGAEEDMVGTTVAGEVGACGESGEGRGKGGGRDGDAADAEGGAGT